MRLRACDCLIALGRRSAPLLAVGAVVFALAPTELHGAKPVAIEHALKIMDAPESRWQRAQWDIEVKYGKVKDAETLAGFSPAPEYHRGSVVFEPTSGRYRFDLDSVYQWTNGHAPYIAARELHAFDGAEARQWYRKKPGTELPGGKDHPGLAEIGAQPENIVDNRSGISYFPPYIDGRRVSICIREALKRNEAVSIEEDADGLWRIRLPDPGLQHYTDPVIRGVYEIQFDPAKGLAIGSTSANGKVPKAYYRVKIELQDVGENTWVPSAVHQTLLIPKRVMIAEYRNVKLNAPVSADQFRPELPPGTRVTDHVQEKMYVVGQPIENEHKNEHSGGNALWTVVAIVAIVVLIAGLWILRKKRRRSGTASMPLSSR
ncbi:MAG: hypothetical protein FJ271_05365 [Planctomycetes bacterium]|nr:hypothetical protein [Planctomycetota bacterium]